MFKRSSIDMNAPGSAVKPEQLAPPPEATASPLGAAVRAMTSPAPRNTSADCSGDKPDGIICDTLHIRGELEYERLLRVDGTFEGKLITRGSLVVNDCTINKGSLIVGKTGSVTANVVGMKEVLLDGGVLHGNISCDSLVMKNGARIEGDIVCDALTIDGTCKIKGKLEIR